MWNHKLSLLFDVSLHLSSASTLYSRRCQYSHYIPDVGSRVRNFKAEFGMPKYQVYLICSSNFTCSILQLYSTSTHLISQTAREKRLRFQAAFGMALKWQVNRNHFRRFYCSMLQLYSTSPTPLYQEVRAGPAMSYRGIWDADERTSLPDVFFLHVGDCKVTAPTLCQKAGVALAFCSRAFEVTSWAAMFFIFLHNYLAYGWVFSKQNFSCLWNNKFNFFPNNILASV